MFEGEAEHPEDGYLTDLITDRALDYVQRMAGVSAPFFLSLHYTAPHWPWETRDDRELANHLPGSLFHLSGGNIHAYRRMIHHMDEGIGQLLARLRKQGQLDNTLVVFTSDNGGERFSDNWPLVGGKMDLTEGGIRVPYIAQWPAVVEAGAVSEQHCLTMDWSATMLDAAGVAAHADYPLDGRSLLPVLRDAATVLPRPMFWRMNHRGQRAHRDGDWKYLRVDGNDYLFNITEDERERANHGSSAAGAARNECATPGWRGTSRCHQFPMTPPSAWVIRSRTCRSVERRPARPVLIKLAVDSAAVRRYHRG